MVRTLKKEYWSGLEELITSFEIVARIMLVIWFPPILFFIFNVMMELLFSV